MSKEQRFSKVSVRMAFFNVINNKPFSRKRFILKAMIFFALLSVLYRLMNRTAQSQHIIKELPHEDAVRLEFNDTRKKTWLTDEQQTSELHKPVVLPIVNVKGIDCKNLFNGDKKEQNKASMLSKIHKYEPKTAIFYINASKDCSQFRTERGYILDTLTQEEANFPIAFSLLMYKDVEQSERLLRAIYRPQNYYCIHVDTKSSKEVRDAMTGIASCFGNVFLSSKSTDVRWGHYSVLEPEITCMQDLWKYAWRYFINLTGQEFPLKTNAELVSILQTLNGANNMEGTIERMQQSSRDRTKFVHDGLRNTMVRKPPPPVNVTFIKGSVHIVAQRGFVDFVLHDKRAIMIRDYLKDTGVPDETLFATLNYNKQLKVPGAYLGDIETDKIDVPEGKFPSNPFIARFKNWGDTIFNWPCHGIRVRQICVLGYGDLPLLASRKELFANKFETSFEYEAYDCLEQLHYNKTLQQIKNGLHLNTSFYRHMDIVHNHI